MMTPYMGITVTMIPRPLHCVIATNPTMARKPACEKFENICVGVIVRLNEESRHRHAMLELFLILSNINLNLYTQVTFLIWRERDLHPDNLHSASLLTSEGRCRLASHSLCTWPGFL